MSKDPKSEHATWQLALATLAAPEALDRIDLVGQRGIKMRSLSVSASADGIERSVWFTGKREPIRSGLQQVIEQTLGVAHRWLIRWIQGRWPRGPLTLELPLNGGIAGLSLGIIAPLSPTRIALSEGPLPFSPPSVKHFKALHAATLAPGLSGCRLGFSETNVAHVAIRWKLELSGLKAVMAQHELSAILDEELMPIVQGLTEGLSASEVTLEACYTPEPPSAFAIEVGPVPSARVIGLCGAIWGSDAKSALTESARLLTQRWTHRVRLEFDASGLKRTTALLTTEDVNRADW